MRCFAKSLSRPPIIPLRAFYVVVSAFLAKCRLPSCLQCSESTLKGWALLGIVSGAFAPSKDFEPYLLSYCDAHREVRTLVALQINQNCKPTVSAR
jgi:hypothetical protein